MYNNKHRENYPTGDNDLDRNNLRRLVIEMCRDLCGTSVEIEEHELEHILLKFTGNRYNNNEIHQYLLDIAHGKIIIEAKKTEINKQDSKEVNKYVDSIIEKINSILGNLFNKGTEIMKSIGI